MAKAILTKKSLVLKYQKGVYDSGSPKFSTQKFSKIKVDAEDENTKYLIPCSTQASRSVCMFVTLLL